MAKIVLTSTPLSLGQGAALPGWYQDRGYEGAGALCTAPGTALAVAADTSFCLHASLTALLPGCV